MRRDEAELRARLLVASLSLTWIADTASPGFLELSAGLAAGALFIAVWIPWDDPKQRG